MPKQGRDRNARGDGTVTTVGIALAVSAAGFAGYMLFNGPLLPGRDFTLIDLAANRQNDGQPFGPSLNEADPIVTGSLSAGPIVTSEKDVPVWFDQPGRPIDYRLLSVGQNSALVSVSSGADSFTYKVETGAILPGLGRVRRIGLAAGGWQIDTGRMRVSARGVVLTGEPDAEQGAQSRQ